jgi:hypothetical protein
MFEQLAHQDFDKAYRRGFWRKLSAWLTGKSNDLLPYDEVRSQLPIQGQRDAGLQTVALDKIVGSVGRYRDFDRAFLPTQRVTSNRWINISKARYQETALPAIEVYQLGEVYFVKDGNHRVSVARERDQDFIDAYVIEINVPVALTPEMALDDVAKQGQYALFKQQTNLIQLRPDADLQVSDPQAYRLLQGHIETHAYYLSHEQNRDILYEEAVVSWYDNVYSQLVAIIKEHKLAEALPGYTLTDLYLFVSDYQWLLRESDEEDEDQSEISEKMAELYSEKEVRRVLKSLRRANWISQMILDQERVDFLAKTQLEEIRPKADIRLSLPGKYDNLLGHIYAHHYYLGLERKADVPFSEAVASFYDNVYVPLLVLIDDQGTIEDFQPRRSEADLVLWVLDHRQDLVQVLSSLPKPPEAA